MTPHSRENRALPLALYAGFALASSAAALAGTQRHPFVLTAYGAGPGGRDLLAGRYPAALRQLRARGSAPRDPRAFSANRCVAFEMTQHLRAAQSACDTAVLAAVPSELVPRWVSVQLLHWRGLLHRCGLLHRRRPSVPNGATPALRLHHRPRSAVAVDPHVAFAMAHLCHLRYGARPT